MKVSLFFFSISLLAGCSVKVPVSSIPNPSKTNGSSESTVTKNKWIVVESEIAIPKLKEDFELFFCDNRVFMIPSSGCIVDYKYDTDKNELNKLETCESLIYEVTENGLLRMPEIPLNEKPVSLTSWNQKLLLAAEKSELYNEKEMVSHIIIYELDETNNSWKVFSPYGFTKEFYPDKKGNGLTYAELGGIKDGPLYLIYGDPHLKMIAYENDNWSIAPSEKESEGGIAGHRGQIIKNKFYYSFQDYGHSNIGPHIKQVDSLGNLEDLGGFPITTATNSNIAFSGDGSQFILLTANARKDGENFGRFELRTLKNGSWETMPKDGLPDNLTHYWTYTFNNEHYISARIAPSSGSVYQAKASVYKFNGASWIVVGYSNFSTVMPNYPKVFSLKGNIYCVFNEKDGGYTLMKLIN